MKAKIGSLMTAAGLVLTAAVVLVVKYDDWFLTPKLIEANRSHVVQQMRDPATVQFRNEHLNKFGWLCGELNGKNAYGAYTGFKRFMSRSYDNAWIEEDGYAGKLGARSTAQITEDLSEKNKILGAYLDVMKTSSLPMPSSQELDDHVEKQVFQQRWKNNCT